MTIRAQYQTRYDQVLLPLAGDVEKFLQDLLRGEPRIDRIGARAKSVDRFLTKSENLDDKGIKKYDDPLAQIQDQIGARITVFYKSDVSRICNFLMRYLHPVESKNLVPASEWEFGYFGWHSVCLFPQELILPKWAEDHVPQFFELQVKTLFQHAWSEANHDLGYKPENNNLSSEDKRILAYTSAQAWGADRAFEELFTGICDDES